MEPTIINPEEQEQRTGPALRPWVTPTFELIPMKEALFDEGYPGSDAGGYGIFYS